MKYRIGLSFHFPILIFGVVLLLAGFGALIEIWWLGIPFILGGIFILTSSYGSEIHLTKNQFREYGSIFFLKTGKWKPLDRLPYITYMKSRTGMTVRSQSNRATTVMDNGFEVYLLTETHRTKYLVQKFGSKEEALSFAQNLSITLEKELVQYHPQPISRTGRKS